MRFSKRLIIFSIFALVALFIALTSSFIVIDAQGEPTAIVDAVFSDLSQKLGATLTRTNVDTWAWEQIDFPDSSLGCPQPGQSYTQAVTRGYKVLVTANGIAYDYRATQDGRVIFQCTNQVAPAATPTFANVTAAPTIPPRTATPTLLPGQPVTFTKPLAYVRIDGNVFITSVSQGAGVPVTNTSTGQQSQVEPFFTASLPHNTLKWSPDGTKLLFKDRNRTLFVVESGKEPARVANGVSLTYPAAWSPDSKEIAYAVDTRETRQQAEVRQIQAVQVTDTGISAPRVAGSFEEGVGCGGGGFDPAEIAYMEETGYAGSRPVLEWTTQGFLHSMNCQGAGLALVKSDGSVIWTAPDVTRSVVSPDQKRAVALRLNLQLQTSSMVMIDLADGKVTPLESQPNPDQVAWSKDNSTIIYSTRTPGQTVAGNPQSAVGKQLFPSRWPFEAKGATISLFRMPAEGGESTRLFQREGRGIGMISPAPDNSGVAISFIPSLLPIVQGINNGAPPNQAVNAAPRPQTLVVTWDAKALPVVISFGGQPAFGTAEFVVAPLAGPPPTVSVSAPHTPPTEPSGNTQPAATPAPPNLVIGGQAVVTTTGNDTLNLREAPTTTSAVVRVLRAGQVVKILSGPQPGDGFRWWRVEVVNDGAIGWAVDQVTDETGTTNTLTPR